jgi:predicted dehydrogenase
VYTEKPLSHNVFEARRCTEAAAKAKQVSQLGTQIHAGRQLPAVVELIRAGAIGAVREAHVFVNKNWGRPTSGRPAITRPCPRG